MTHYGPDHDKVRLEQFTVCCDLLARFLDPLGVGGIHYLDLGCGHCKFMLAAEARGWVAGGVDARMERVPPALSPLVFQGRIPDCLHELADFKQVHVVGILGLLYHMELDDQLELASRVTGKYLILDTHLAQPVRTAPVYVSSDAPPQIWGMSACAKAEQAKPAKGGYVVPEGTGVKAGYENKTSFWPSEDTLYRTFEHHQLFKLLPEHFPARSFFAGIPK